MCRGADRIIVNTTEGLNGRQTGGMVRNNDGLYLLRFMGKASELR